MVWQESSASTSRPSFPIPDLHPGFTPVRHHNQLPQGTRPSVSIYDVVGEIRHLIAVWWWWDDVDDNNRSILQNQPIKWISQKMAPDHIFTWYISRESPLCYSLILPFESETFIVRTRETWPQAPWFPRYISSLLREPCVDHQFKWYIFPGIFLWNFLTNIHFLLGSASKFYWFFPRGK